jgi:ACR3 family arsenite transporter
MFTLSFLLVNISVHDYSKAQQLLTATGNNFRRLAIAVAIGVFGIDSGQAFADDRSIVRSQHSLHLNVLV